MLIIKYYCNGILAAHDTQVDEMQETIISKDAKLSAMQNTLAVSETITIVYN